ncbi:VOC family protein [Nakamurella leprariae]|uniref:Putative pterin-4-alpha-carbinolamine dehydratase n=1 Tax=Nakamurella leprariae TaxID=2803911 RepID=A0A938YEQ2_9ACTN|nr:VOC family protein [Nakamurella leprariae]MBM9468186.1 4a-hydroxytetrahydrobiopterin dehydratase [Nakamurella leprariae]
MTADDGGAPAGAHRVLQILDGALRARFRAPSFLAAMALVQEVGEHAERVDHHPDMDVRWREVEFALASHDVGAITDRDTALAAVIADLAQRHGAEPVPVRHARVELGIDTADAGALRPFWLAVTGGTEVDTEFGPRIEHPSGLRLWFQESEPRPGRNRLHLDCYPAPGTLPAVLDAAVVAGGRLVTDEFAPHWWVLADPDGNEVCLCQEEPGTTGPA